MFELQAPESERAPEPGRPARLALPPYENLRLVSKENGHIFEVEMSLTEIIEQLPKLTPEERQAIYRRIEMLDGEPEFTATPEMLAAIEEGTRSAQTERTYTSDEIKVRIREWATTSSE
jgi:hypothetical protein